MIDIDGVPRSMYGGNGPVGAPNGILARGGPGPPDCVEPNVRWGDKLRNSRQYTLLKKVVRLLQDNRASPDDPQTTEQLKELNRSQTDSYPILKTVLNGVFVSIGVILLVGVVIVIICTSLVKPESDPFRRFFTNSAAEVVPNRGGPHHVESALFYPSAEYDAHGSPPQPTHRDINDGVGETHRNDDDGDKGSMSSADDQAARVKDERSRPDSSKGSVLIDRISSSVRTCRFTPLVVDGQEVVQFGEICYYVSPSPD